MEKGCFLYQTAPPVASKPQPPSVILSVQQIPQGIKRLESTCRQFARAQRYRIQPGSYNTSPPDNEEEVWFMGAPPAPLSVAFAMRFRPYQKPYRGQQPGQLDSLKAVDHQVHSQLLRRDAGDVSSACGEDQRVLLCHEWKMFLCLD